ncbi:thiosulfate sulfurtransferase GlpE [Neptunomonas antarctica]|uniref:Thiosulfate sulfurtransferase GlpE n=1 Tax=Neptunomonas antarctica TaxID=619304 RepID=A0A1N7JDH4_9GAMM|nr:thiosulfate sulfurtransferase GlpE [Neptunomonas antarctica]SIS47432.1 thiosulfate sulfurtransferase [Neptunomonas antarctica]
MTDKYTCINSGQAIEWLEKGAIVADIRDSQSFQQGHIPGAFNLSNDNMHEFMLAADFEKPLIVCCYHGISSQSAAQYLVHQGFEQVCSLDGGFEDWGKTQPEHIESTINNPDK